MAEQFRNLKAITIPVMTTVERDALTPFLGLIIYNLISDQLEVWDGDSWSANIVRFSKLEALGVFAGSAASTPSAIDNRYMFAGEGTLSDGSTRALNIVATYNGSASTPDTTGAWIETKFEGTGGSSSSLDGLVVIAGPTAGSQAIGTVSVITAFAGCNTAYNGSLTTVRVVELTGPTGLDVFPTNTEGLFVANQGLSGVTNSYGIHIGDQQNSTNNYGISIDGATNLNWIRGKTSIGATSRPTSITDPLAVTGNIAVTGTVDGVDIAARDHATAHGPAQHTEGTAWRLLYLDASGDEAEIAFPNAGGSTLGYSYLRATGASGVPEFQELMFEKTITVEDPTSSEDIGIHFFHLAVTIREVHAVVVGSSTPSVTIEPTHHTDRSNAGNDLLSSATAITNTTTGQTLTTFDDNTLPANSFLWLETTAQSGTVDELQVTFRYTFD